MEKQEKLKAKRRILHKKFGIGFKIYLFSGFLITMSCSQSNDCELKTAIEGDSTSHSIQHSIYDRPENIPRNCLFVGGSDGGVWVNIANSNDSMIYFEVYASVTGVDLVKSWYVKDTDCLKKMTLDDIRKNISSFDGSEIFVVNPKTNVYCKLSSNGRSETNN